MSSVAERQETFLAEHGRFVKNRGASAPVWVRELRERGAARFAALGFPTVRQEDWRFTNVSAVADTPFKLAELEAVVGPVELDGDMDAESGDCDRGGDPEESDDLVPAAGYQRHGERAGRGQEHERRQVRETHLRLRAG